MQFFSQALLGSDLNFMDFKLESRSLARDSRLINEHILFVPDYLRWNSEFAVSILRKISMQLGYPKRQAGCIPQLLQALNKN